MCVTGVGIGRFCVQYRLCVVQLWGSADSVFNIGYVCYRCGDRHILSLI